MGLSKEVLNALNESYESFKKTHVPSRGGLPMMILGKSIQFLSLLNAGAQDGENFLKYPIVTYIIT